jgi:hypothetical protein
MTDVSKEQMLGFAETQLGSSCCRGAVRLVLVELLCSTLHE